MGGSDEGGVGGVEGGVEGDFGDGGSAGLGFGLDPCLSGSVRLSRTRCFGSAEKSRVWAARMSGAVVDLVCSEQLVEGSVRGKRARDTQPASALVTAT